MSIPERRPNISICRLGRGVGGNRRFQISGARIRFVLRFDSDGIFLLLGVPRCSALFRPENES